ncbi:hypothetical protein DL96DRAFT_1678170 [Flagelloscypha sp. PMI_526]|nr:hypothetical protein DL96DRAFT_1678170 [Flagelloscypha sp. PMI_526]
MADTYTVDGSCLCKKIKYVVKDLDLTAGTRCNCSICEKLGRTGIFQNLPNRVLLIAEDKEIPITRENANQFEAEGLGAYISNLEKHAEGEHEVYNCFCRFCGTHVFVVAFSKSMDWDFMVINLRALEVESCGKTMKVLTGIKNLTYINGRGGTFAGQKGEPWLTGSW